MELVRRSRIGTERKLALLTIGSYANTDGTSVFCGVARLAVDCEVSYRTASRYLAWARDSGLIEMVQRGNRRRGKADLYRLIADPVMLQRITLPDPDQYRQLIGDVAEANRAGANKRQRAGRHGEGEEAVSTAINDDRRSGDDLRPQGDRRNQAPDAPSTDTQVSAETRFYGHEGDVSTDTPGVRPPSIDHLSVPADLPWVPTDLRNAREPSLRVRVEDGQDSSTTTSTTRPPGRTCTCGAELDPDGSCFMCRLPARPRTPTASAVF
ncbi:hypothetical protein [Streptosporangium roseum]|uniref:hypothetical protein n=1 Tax=Streptosporangium roseum TaxID=2001 RepID=UPI0034369F3F